MRAYSTDLRERVVAACDARHGTRAEIAARFSVSESWIRKLLRRRRDTGSIAPKPRGGGREAAFDARAAARLREAVRDDDDATLEELGRAAGVSAAPRRCTGPCGGWASRAKKVAAGGRAGPAGAEGRAGRLAGGVRRHRPVPAGVRRRERGPDGDGPHPWPGAQRGACRRAGAPRPPEGRHADGRRAARRRAGVGLPGLRRGDRLGRLRDLCRSLPGAGAEARRHRDHG